MVPFQLNRKIELCITAVDSIPCSLVGNTLVLEADGLVTKVSWKMPWPMEWVEKTMIAWGKAQFSVSGKKTTKLYNEEEKDQWIQVESRSFIPLTTSQFLEKITQRFPQKEALIDRRGEKRFSYKAFSEAVDCMAKGLLDLGIEKGDGIGFLALNSIELAIAQFAVPKIGAVLIPLSVHEPGTDICFKLRQSEAKMLFIQSGVRGNDKFQRIQEICPEIKEGSFPRSVCKDLPDLKHVAVFPAEYPGTISWKQLMERGEKVDQEALAQRENQLSVDDIIYVLHTSGTTGMPKGVILSHGNVIENAVAINEKMKLSDEDVFAVLAPMFHCFGCITNTLAVITAGASMIMLERFKPSAAINVIQRESCSVLSGVPTLFLGLIKECQKRKMVLPSLRTGVVAGAGCQKEIFQCIYNILGMKEVISSYGLTETSPCVTATDIDDTLATKAQTVGRPIAGVQIEIVDIKTGEKLPTGSVGEIWVSGYNVTPGYYKMEEETQKIINKEGWLQTGDLGFLDQSGRLHLKGRIKELIIKRGENIAPVEIENCLIQHPGVKAVQAVGVPDFINSEEIVVFIEKQGNKDIGAKEVREYCRGKMSTIKIPQYVFFVQEYPLTATGKVDRKALRKQAMKTVGCKKEIQCN